MKRLWSRLSLTGKILSIIVLTTLLATVTIIPAIFLTIRDGMLKQQREQLTGIRNLVEGLLEENRRAIRNYAVLFATDRDVRDNLFYHTELAGEREHPLRAVEQIAEAFDVGYVELCDRQGRVVANTEYPALYDVDRSADPLVRAALAGRTVEGIHYGDDGFRITAVTPVDYEPGRRIGTLSTGVRMDGAFVENLKNLSRAELAVLDAEGRVRASTLDEAPAPTGGAGAVVISGRRYLLMRLPLQNADAEPLGQLLIMTPDTLPIVIRRAHLTVTAILALITLVSVGATVLIVRRLLAPVGQLRDGAARIGRGDFSRRIPVTSRDEIGGLAEVFNQMADDLERLRAVEEKLRHSERLASLGRFTAGIAHELNNPVANILGLVKLVRKDLGAGHPSAEDLEMVIREATRCGEIVRDLLLYSRPEPGDREELDVNDLVRETLAALESTLERHGVRARTELAGGLPPLRLNRTQMEQALRNLIVNAAQASRPGETVRIGTAMEDDRLRIRVADEGEGIAPGDLDKIFYPFFTTKEPGTGTGLGLAVTYGIVQSHGGEIRVESTPGEGTRFDVLLPAKRHDDA